METALGADGSFVAVNTEDLAKVAAPARARRAPAQGRQAARLLLARTKYESDGERGVRAAIREALR